MKKNDLKIIIVVSEFYPELTELLLDDCINQLANYGIKDDSISTYKVSGVFELPGIVSQCLKYHEVDAIITLGVVIKGETPHFDYICHQFDFVLHQSQQSLNQVWFFLK